MNELDLGRSLGVFGRIRHPVAVFRYAARVLVDQLIEAYGGDVDGFLQKGARLGAEQFGHGDSSLKLFPFPRVPIVLLLWKEDEEFPARADILFDSTCSIHLPTDIIWSTAMMTILVILK